MDFASWTEQNKKSSGRSQTDDKKKEEEEKKRKEQQKNTDNYGAVAPLYPEYAVNSPVFMYNGNTKTSNPNTSNGFTSWSAANRAQSSAGTWAKEGTKLINEIGSYYSQWGSKEEQDARAKEFTEQLNEFINASKGYQNSFKDRLGYNALTEAMLDAPSYMKDARDMYSQFGSQKEFDTAVKISEWQKKYSGYTYSQKKKAIADMKRNNPSATADERRWLESTIHDNATAKEYDDFIKEKEQELEEYKKTWNGKSTAALADAEGAANAWMEKKTELDNEISIAKSRRYMLQKGEEYEAVKNNADFARFAKLNPAQDIRRIVSTGGHLVQGEYVEDVKPEGDWEPEDWTQDEVDTATYIYNTQGEQAAKEYWDDYLKYVVLERAAQRKQQENAAYATKNFGTGALASLGSVGATLMSGTGLTSALGQNIRNKLSGEEGYRPINYYGDAFDATRYSSAVRGAISEKLDSKGTIQLDENEHPFLAKVLNGKGLGFLYQTGMSMADSAALAGITMGLAPALGAAAKFSTVILGGSAGSQGILDALERGASDEQAILMGVFNATFETLFEEVSLDHLIHPDKNFIVNLFKQGFIEGSEEVSTSFFNNIADVAIMASNSEYMQKAQTYMDQGLTEEQAMRKALRDTAIDIMWDYIGGALSGGLMGAGSTARVNIMRNASFTNLARNMDAQDVISDLQSIDPNNKLAGRMQARLSAEGDVSTWNKARMLNQTEQAVMQNDVDNVRTAVVNRLTELGETQNVEQVADAIVNVVTAQQLGDEVSRKSVRRIEDSTYGNRVLNELDGSNAASGDYSSEWTRNIRTEILGQSNRDVYIFQRAVSNYINNNEQELAEEGFEVVRNEEGRALGVRPVEDVEEEPLDINEASQKYGSNAQKMIDAYEEGQNVRNYDAAFNDVYNMARSDVPLESAINAMKGSILSESQVKAAYEAGADAAQINTAATAQLVSARQMNQPKKKGRRIGSVRGDGVTISDLESALADVAEKSGEKARDFARKTIRVLNAISNVTGVDIVLFKSDPNSEGKFTAENGRYEWKDSKIYIDINAGLMNIDDFADIGKRTILQTFTHEFVHFMEQWNAVDYRELRRAVMDEIAKKEDPDALIRSKMEVLGIDDYELASREVVADGLSSLLPESSFVETLAQKHQNIFQKLLTKLKEFLNDLKSVFSEAGGQRHRETGYLTEDVDGTVKYISGIVELFDRVAQGAVENYQATLEGFQENYEEQTESTSVETAEAIEPEEDIEETLRRADEEVTEIHLADIAKLGSLTGLAEYRRILSDEFKDAIVNRFRQLIVEQDDPLRYPNAIKNELGIKGRTPSAAYSGDIARADKLNDKQKSSLAKKVMLVKLRHYDDAYAITDGINIYFISADAADAIQNDKKFAKKHTFMEPTASVSHMIEEEAIDPFEETGKRITSKPIFDLDQNAEVLNLPNGILFEQDGEFTEFNLKRVLALDGGAFYLAQDGRGTKYPKMLFATDENGNLTGFLMPVRMTDAKQEILKEIYTDYEKLRDNIEYSQRDREAAFDALSFKKTEQYIDAGLPVAPEAEVEWSIRTNDKQMEKTEKYVDANGKRISKTNLKSVRKLRERVAAYLKENEKELNLPNEVIGNPFVKNGSYDKSYDPTTICVRSLGILRVQQLVSEKLGRPLTARENFAIAQEAFEWTDNPQCLYCFAALDRMAKSEYLMDFINRQDRAVKALNNGATKADAYKAFLPDGHNGSNHMQKVFNGIYDRWKNNGRLLTLKDAATYENLNKLINKKDVGGFGELAYWAEQYAQNASWAKGQRQYVAYNGQILKWSKTEIRKLNSHYGLRLNSHSEFSPAFILEYLQVYTDAAARGLKALEYTSDINAAKIFAPTGAGINMSISITGDTYDNLGEDAMQGCPWAEARAVREKYPNAGIVAVTLNDEQTRWALDQDWVDVVLPMHLVKTGDEIAKFMKWTNTKAINEDAKQPGWDETKDAAHIYPGQHLNDKETYLRLCAENHLTPRFKKWLDNPNYMKLVNETRQATTEMTPLRPVFDEDALWSALKMMKARGGYFERLGHTEEGESYIVDQMAERFKNGPTYFEGNPRANVAAEMIQRSNRYTVDNLSAEQIAARENITDKQREIREDNLSNDVVGSKLRTLGDSDIARYKNNVGKEVSGDVYLHKNYATDVIPEDTYEKALDLLHAAYGDVRFTTLVYNKKKGTVRFDEAPDFDSAREPIPGNQYTVTVSTGKVEFRRSESIWHHKWMWVKNDYKGFDVGDSWRWSREWLSYIRKVPLSEHVFESKTNQLGRANGSGKGTTGWNEQLAYFGLKADTDSVTEYSARRVDPIPDSEHKEWKNTHTNAEAMAIAAKHGVKMWETNVDENEKASEEAGEKKRNPTQVKITTATYSKIAEFLKGRGFTGRILDASSGLGMGTRALRKKNYDVTDLEPFADEYKYMYDASVDPPLITEMVPDSNGKKKKIKRPETVKHPDYTKYEVLEDEIRTGKTKPFDFIISNAVLNVLPQDERDATLVSMGNMLAPGGQMFINVRPKGDINKLAAETGNIKLGDGEAVESKKGSYQYGFTPGELLAYVRDRLGPGFTVKDVREAINPDLKKAIAQNPDLKKEGIKTIDSPGVLVTKGIAEYSRRVDDLDEEYMAAVKSGDEMVQSRLVAEAAKAAGAISAYGSPIKLYHGTESFGFTEFDLNAMDDRRSIFLTDSETVAKTYSGKYGVRAASKSKNDTKPSVWDMSLPEILREYSENYPEDEIEIASDDKLQKLADARLYKLDRNISDAKRFLEMLNSTEGDWFYSDFKDLAELPGAHKEFFADARRVLEDLVHFENYKAARSVGEKALFLKDRAILFKALAQNFNERYAHLRNLDSWLNNGNAAALFSTLNPYRASALAIDAGEYLNATGRLGFLIDEGYGQITFRSASDIRQELERDRKYGQKGNYGLFAFANNLLVVNAKGDFWNGLYFEPPSLKTLRINRDQADRNARANADADTGEVNPSYYEVFVRASKEYQAELDRLYSTYRIKGEEGTNKTRAIAHWAKDNGYDGVVFKGISDVGNYAEDNFVFSDVYVLFDPHNVKSSDPITYDENGDVIPLTERFNIGKTNILYSRRANAEYMDAVNRKDMDAAQQMVDEAAVDAGWRPRNMYHGTQAYGFTTFDKSKADVEGNSGAGFYFSTSKKDTKQNYESESGPDPMNKLNRLADMIADNGEWDGREVDDYDQAKSIARQLIGTNPGVYNVYLKYDRPYVRNYSDSTNLYNDFVEGYDSEEYEDVYDYLADKVGRVVRSAIRKFKDNYELVNYLDSSYITSEIVTQLLDYNSLTWADIEKIVNSDNGVEVVGEFETKWADSELTRQIIEELGYDAIVDKEVAKKFWRMFGPEDAGTEHIIVFNPNQIKSADPVTYDDKGNVIPLSERFNPNNNDIRYSRRERLPATLRASYNTSVIDGDVERQQELVDKAAELAMPNSKVRGKDGKLRLVYHYTDGKFTKFERMDKSAGSSRTLGDGFYISTSEGEFKRFGKNQMRMYANITNPFEMELTADQAQQVYDKYFRPFHEDRFHTYEPHVLDALQSSYKVFDYLKEAAEKNNTTTSEILSELGFDGVHSGNEWVAFNSSQLKSADPVTYDDDGKVVSLSNRFDDRQADIRFQRRLNTLTDRELLQMSADDLIESNNLSEGERGALAIFTSRLGKLQELRDRRAELGTLFHDQQFGKGGDRSAAQETRQKMQILDQQIEAAENELVAAEDKAVLKNVLKRARENVERIDREQAAEMVRRYRDRRDNAEAVRKYRKRIKTDTTEIATWITRPNSKDAMKNVPAAIRKPIIEILLSIDKTSKRALAGGNMTKADQEYIKQLRALQVELGKTKNADELYSGYADLGPDFQDRVDKVVEIAENIAERFKGSYYLNQMDSEELKTMAEFVRMLKKFIHNASQQLTFSGSIAELGDESIADMKQMKALDTKGGERFFMYQTMRPIAVFDRFGRGGKRIFKALVKGQAQMAFDTKEIIAKVGELYTSKEAKEWTSKLIEVTLGGEKVQMPISYAMGLYELSKRKNAEGHLYGNGVRVATFKNGRNKISDVGHNVTPQEIAALGTQLKNIDPRIIEVADALQKYMAEKGAEWGNYISMARLGVEQFTEKDYYPIASDGRFLPASADEKPAIASLYALLNMSFTKDLKENANNRAVVYDIFDVFANHMSAMAQYHSFALPVLDALKWMNYEQFEEVPDTYKDGRPKLNDDGTPKMKKGKVTGSVREEMARVFGNDEEKGRGGIGYANTFVTNILKAINGTEAQGDTFDTAAMKLLRAYNVSRIAYNVRVVLQQPMALTRAGMVMNYSSISKALARPDLIAKNIQEMESKNGIAAWKGLGFYDVNVTRSMTDLIKHNETALQKFNEVGLKGAEIADRVTWAIMWQAAKNEVQRKMHLSEKDAGYWDAVNDIFDETIYRTQVVDSVLTKNEYLRSKGFFARTSGSFMSEPMTTYSMLASAYDNYRMDRARGMTKAEAWKKNGKNIARTAAVYSISAILLAAVQGVADAWRDDDKYETFNEKYIEAFKDNVIDELVPFNNLPIFSDVWNVSKQVASILGADTYGSDPRQLYLEFTKDLIPGIQRLYDLITKPDEAKYTWYGAIYKLLSAASGMTGVPFSTITREVVDAWNNTVAHFAPSLLITDYNAGYKNEIKYAFADGYLTQEEAISELVARGSEDDIDENAAYWLVNGWKTGNSSKYGRLDNSLLENPSDVKEAIKELTDHGVKAKDVNSHIKSKVGSWYRGDEEVTITRTKAKELLLKNMDMEDQDVEELLDKWTMKNDTGIAYDDMKEAYLDGEITYDDAIYYRTQYGNVERDVAKKTVDDWKIEKQYGFVYDELDDAFLAGKMSSVQLKNAYITHGYDEEKAGERVELLEFKKKYPKAKDFNYATMRDYKEYCEADGISVDTFYEVWKFNNNTSADVDANGNSINGSKRVKVLEFIDSMNISDFEKDSLYFACGYAQSTLKKAPWHTR